MAVSDSIAGAVDFARSNPVIAAGVAVVIMGGGAVALLRSKNTGESGTASMIYGMVGDSSKFPPDGYPAIIQTQPGSAPTPAPIPAPSKEPSKPPSKPKPGGSPGDVIDQKGKPFYCPSGSFLTWERGGTGNQVCQRKDGVQFAVKYR